MYKVLRGILATINVDDPRGILFPVDEPMCEDKITGWTCTMNPSHNLPHAAGDGDKVWAVWDNDRSTDSLIAKFNIWWENRAIRKGQIKCSKSRY